MHGTDENTAALCRRFEATGRDPGLASAHFETAYGGRRFRVVPAHGDFSFRYAYVGDDRLTLRASECAGTLTGEVTHLTEYVVAWFRMGTGSVHLGGDSRRGATSAPFLLPSEQPFALNFEAHRQNLIHLAQPFLEDVASEFHAGPRQRVAFDHMAEPVTGAVERWRRAVTTVTAAIVDAATAPLLRLQAQLGLARAILELFPWRVWDVPAVLRAPSAARARVALDWMHHHAAEAITPADAARAAGLHMRSLQLATQAHLGMSPTAYLRSIRLDRVHESLLAADPRASTVSSIAQEWGFGHLGRFAGEYAQRFGEKPNETLRF